MSFLEFDYDVVRGCVANRRYAWEEFVDRFMDLTLRVVERAAERKSIRLDDEQKIELCEAIFRAFRYDDYRLLREFSYDSAVSTYLVVVARRLAIALLDES